MPEQFEITTELDEVFALNLDGPKPIKARAWKGVRVRYRSRGTRGRWRTFLLEYDDQPTLEQLQTICAQHEAGPVDGDAA